jgi:hypothetical protein
LEGVDEEAAALGVELVGGQALDDLAEGGLELLASTGGGKGEATGGAAGIAAGGGVAGWVVEVA